jgi:hypothetical protein
MKQRCAAVVLVAATGEIEQVKVLVERRLVVLVEPAIVRTILRRTESFFFTQLFCTRNEIFGCCHSLLKIFSAPAVYRNLTAVIEQFDPEHEDIGR